MRLGDEVSQSEGRRVGFAAGTDLAVDVRNMTFDRAHAYDQPFGDFAVRGASCDEAKNLAFSLGEALLSVAGGVILTPGSSLVRKVNFGQECLYRVDGLARRAERKVGLQQHETAIGEKTSQVSNIF
jgi:hypothetical protein